VPVQRHDQIRHIDQVDAFPKRTSVVPVARDCGQQRAEQISPAFMRAGTANVSGRTFTATSGLVWCRSLGTLGRLYVTEDHPCCAVGA
jgi:hypothetical protein